MIKTRKFLSKDALLLLQKQRWNTLSGSLQRDYLFLRDSNHVILIIASYPLRNGRGVPR